MDLLHVLGSSFKLRTEIFILRKWATNKRASSSLSPQSSNCLSSRRVWCPLVLVMIWVGCRTIALAAVCSMRKGRIETQHSKNA